MPIKDPEKRREYHRKYHRKYHAKRLGYNTERKKVRRLEIRDFLKAQKDKPCTDCGSMYPHYVMDFDHRDPSTKTIDPARIPTMGWGDKRIQEELDKCDLVCSNCHRIRTHGTVTE